MLHNENKIFFNTVDKNLTSEIRNNQFKTLKLYNFKFREITFAVNTALRKVLQRIALKQF